MFRKFLLLIPALFVGAALMGAGSSAALANPDEHHDEEKASPAKMHEHIKARLDKLANRLEIKASQQPAWENFAKSVEALANHSFKHPDENADAAAIAHARAEMADDMAKKLAAIADATDKLEAVLSENQRKVLNEEAHHFHHGMHHCGKHGDHHHDK